MRLALLAPVLALTFLPVAARAETPRGKKYALLVGVNEYAHASLAALRYPEKDVEAVAAVLRRPAAGFTEVRVMSATQGKKDRSDLPTAANVRKALEELMAGKTRHDTVLVGLAGHGVTLEVEDPDGKGRPKTFPYFCPSDADLQGVSYSTGRSAKLVNLNDLFADLGTCGAGTKLFLSDACRNELKAEGSTRSVDVDSIRIPKGVGALFACGPDQKAWESQKLGHGVFFYHVVQALNGRAVNKKGEVRWSRLTEYVTEGVGEAVPKLIGGGARQTPHTITNIVGDSPVLLRAASPPVFQLTPHFALPGKEKALVARDRDRYSPRVKKHGIKSVAAWTPVNPKKGDPTLLILHSHADRKSAERSWDGFFADPEWKKAKAESEKNGQLQKPPRPLYLIPTEYSPVTIPEGTGRVFELRIYHAAPGKMRALHARFRDHTCKLFRKYNMEIVGFWSPTDEKEADKVLYYLLAYPSKEAGEKSWKDFREDADWKKVKAESEKDGKLVEKAESLFLKATDYSPLK